MRQHRNHGGHPGHPEPHSRREGPPTLFADAGRTGEIWDANDESSLVKTIKADQIDCHIENYAKGRMKKKLLGAKEAIEGGVKSVILGDARSESPVSNAFNGQGTIIQ